MKRTFSSVTVELTRGNIVDQPDCDAIVNAANAQLRIGGGVAGAIHRIGDPELESETRLMAPVNPGEAVISSAPNLPNKHIIHCLGPVYGRDEPSADLLRNCYINALKLVEDHQLSSVAFPAISTGAFGFPMNDAATVALQAIRDESGNLEHLRLIRFVLWRESDLEIHKEVLNNL